jgi:hydroxyacylglutathione hydrolase
MIFERIISEGLAHISYFIGSGNEAVVIDPRRDCQVYLDRALREGMKIKYILETHRNEDYVIGSAALASYTDAEIWHADAQLEYKYGQPVEDGQLFEIGTLQCKAIHSPGHTPGSMSYLLYDPDNHPWILFTGDALFAGDVGRVDLLGMDQAEKMASLMYDTLFNKLLPLGDDIIVYPAHGAGSVCGGSIAERIWTTIGFERRYNPKLQYTDRDEFIANVAKRMERPPYFKKMEQLNLDGASPIGRQPVPESPDEFDKSAQDAIVLDTRSELGFGAAHIPNSLFIWLSGLPGYAGWFLSYDQPILLVNETDDPRKAARYLFRLGYDNVAGYFSGGVHNWHMTGRESSSISMITVQGLCRLLDEDKKVWILDVRNTEELEREGMITGAHHIHITQLPHHMNEVPRDLLVYIFCGSGLRSMTAASILKREGWKNLAVVLGGMAGWNSITCPIK